MKIVSIILLFISLVGCQLTPNSLPKTSDYGQYYLWAKGLSQQELIEEVARQKLSKQNGNPQAKEYLLLLHSLPKSPIYNVYTAKTILNHLQLQQIDSQYNSGNLVVTTLLKDQLNQQLLLLQQLKKAKDELKSNQVDKKIIEQLKQQLMQLKNIEKSISERG